MRACTSSQVRFSMRMSLSRDLWPRLIVSQPRGQFRADATTSMTAALAAPSEGAAVTLTRRESWRSPSTALLRPRGLTRTGSRVPLLSRPSVSVSRPSFRYSTEEHHADDLDDEKRDHG